MNYTYFCLRFSSFVCVCRNSLYAGILIISSSGMETEGREEEKKKEVYRRRERERRAEGGKKDTAVGLMGALTGGGHTGGAAELDTER